MLVWKGYGIFVPIVTFLICLVMQYGLDTLFYKGYYTLQQWPISLALFISAVITWFLGKHLNKNNERILIDPNTGEEVKLIKTHSFFWVRAEYWALILFILGLWNLTKLFYP